MLDFENDICLDMVDEAKFMAAEVSCSEEDVDAYLGAETQYLKLHNLIIEFSDDITEDEMKQIVEQEKAKQNASGNDEANVLDVDEMIDYIAANTDLPKKLINKLVDAEYKYEMEHDIIDIGIG